MNALDKFGRTPLDAAIAFKHIEITDLHRKHGGKTKKELEAAEQLNQTAPPLERSRVVVPDRAQSCQAEAFCGNS